MWRINYPLVNKICDAESHFVQISSDFAVIRSLIFLDHLDPLGLKHSLMGSQEHCKEKWVARGCRGEEDQEEEEGRKQWGWTEAVRMELTKGLIGRLHHTEWLANYLIKTLDASHILFNILMVTSYLTVLTLNLTACCATAGVSKGNYNILTEIGFQKGFLSSCF